MYCHLCGREIDDDAVFCPYCGTKIKSSSGSSDRPSARQADGDDFFSEPPVPYSANPYYPPQQTAPAKINTYALVGFILSFFFALGGLICSIIGLKQCTQRGEGGKGFAIAGIVISGTEVTAIVILLSTIFRALFWYI